MDKTFLRRGMASALSLVMAFSTAVPSSLVYAEEATGIESEITQDLTATLGQTENGKVSFVSDGNKSQDPITRGPGDKVELAVEPTEGFNTAKIEVKDADGTVVASLEGGQVTEKDGVYNFEMPESNVTVDVAFEAAPASTEEATEAEAAETEAESETAATETETEKTEETKKQIYDEFNKDSLVSKTVVDQYDFSSREIIVATDDADVIVDKDDIVDSGNGMYVLRYASEEHAKNAYSYYYGKADFVAPNIVVNAAEGETSKDANPADVGTPLDTLNQIGDATTNAKGKVIAVVDSGMPSNSNVTNRVSVINGGTEVGDDNGHGTSTMNSILSVNPDAKILSIKALDANGHGDATSIYAGIEYAKNSGAKIIVLPLYAYSVGDNAALSKVIDEAIASGITVVGAAGNDGANVKYYVPGNIDAAYIVGASNEKGEKLASSNYGSTVDYNVIAGSTSEASAKFAGFLSTIKGNYTSALEKAANEQTLIFRTNEVKKAEDVKEGNETADEVISKYDVDLSKKVIVRYTFVDESLLISNDNWESIMSGDREKIITTTLAEVNLYKAEDGTYRINANAPWANGVASGKPVGYVFANGNDNGETITDGVFFNEDTHVATVTEKTLAAAEGDFANIQMQVIVPTSLNKSANIGLTIESKNNDPIHTEFMSKLFDYPRFSMHVEGADGALSKEDLTVYVNGEETTDDGFDFDSDNNIVTLKSYAISVSDIRVVVNKDINVTFDKAIADGATSVPSQVAFYLKEGTNVSGLSVGSTTTVGSVFGNNGWPRYPRPNSELSDDVIGIVGSTTAAECSSAELGAIGIPKNLFGINFQFYTSSGSSMGSWSESERGTLSGYNIGAPSYCTHESTAYGAASYKDVKYKIIGKSRVGAYIEFTMAYETTTGVAESGIGSAPSQNLGGVIKFRVKDQVKVKIKKTSADTSITNNNPCYSLSGTTYQLKSGSTVVATFTLDANGDCGYAEVQPGNYTLHETKAGKGYALSADKAVTVTSAETQTINVKDDPAGDPFIMSMAKQPLAGGTGDYPTTAGAEFTVSYYAGFYNSEAELPSSPMHTWTFVSKKYTGTKLSKETSIVSFANSAYLKSGSSTAGLIINDNGAIDIPFGTVVIEETKSPASYLPNPTFIVDKNGTEKKSLMLNINYLGGDKEIIAFAGTNTSATAVQLQLEADSITTLTKETMIPTIETNLTASNRTHFTEALDEVRFTDSITLKNCESLKELNAEIRVTGKLYDIDTGEYVTLANGKDFVTTVFTVQDAKETLNNIFVFDASKYAGHSFVAVESVTWNGEEIVNHGNLKDEGQMVHLPKIGTTNLGEESQRHIANIYGDIVLEDTVKYENLKPNTTYTVNGTLMDQKTGKVVLDDEGKEVKSSTTFTTGDATDDDGQTFTGFDEHAVPQYTTDHKVTVSGTAKVTFSFKSSDAAKEAAQKYVAYENIPGFATHEDLSDEGQTVYFPHVDTLASNAKDNATGTYHGHETIALEYTEDVKIKDKVAVTGVSPDAGTLRLDSYLYDVATGKQIYKADGTPVTGSKTFTADNNGNATETVYFETFNAKDLRFEDGSVYNAEGKTVVVYEYLYSENVGVGLEAELTSTEQSVIFPEVHTTATEDKMNGMGDQYIPSYDGDYPASDKAFIQDVVEYKNLLPNTTYHIKGELMNKKTGEAVLDANGNPVVTEQDFTTGEATTDRGLVDGNVTVKFQVKASLMKGVTTVVFETISLDGLEVITHSDINDQAQTDYFPGGHTTLTVDGTDKHYSRAEDVIELTDVVSYENLQPEAKYTVVGRLMRAAEEGETPDAYDENGVGAMYLVDGNGNFVKEVVDFTTPKAAEGEQSVSGTVEVKFTVNAEELSGRTIVAFEDLELKGRTVFVHNDLADEAQSIHFPEIDTIATYVGDDSKSMHVVENAVIKDQVKVFNIAPDAGKVKLTATVYDKETGEQILDANGNPITGSKEFEAVGDTTQTVEIAFNAKKLTTSSGEYVVDGRTVVVFEHLTFDGEAIREHDDLTDIDQAVKFPSAHTTATDDETKDHYVPSVETRTINDVVDFTGLIRNKTYHIKGELMNKKTGEAILDEDGNPIVVETDFVTEDGYTTANGGKVVITNNTPFDNDIDFMETEAFTGNKVSSKLPAAVEAEVTKSGTLVDGNVTVIFTVPGKSLEGTTTVAFETISIDGLEVITHANINDDDQTDYFPGGSTTLTDSDTEDHIANADKTVKLVDTVSYTNMKPETEFTVTGTLMDRETGEAVLDANGEKVTSTTKFTTPAAAEGEKTVDGEVEVVFEFDGSNLEGHTVVAFEKMWRNDLEEDVLMFTHEDINDQAQTLHFPEGETTVEDKDTGNHITSEALEEVSIIDHVYYSNLLPGKEYTVNGVLMDKATGEAFLDEDGKQITASTTFTAPEAEEGKDSVSGSVDVTFTFKGGEYLAGKTLVAFETGQYNGKDIFVHADINDEGQTTYVPDGHTTLVDNATEDHIAAPTEKMSLTDTVYYENLRSGATYTITGKLMDKDTGKPFLVNGEEVTQTKELVIDPKPIVDEEGNEVTDRDGNVMMAPVSGNVEITFEFEGSDEFKGKTLVAFETMTYEGVDVFVHADLEDEEQSVHIPDGHTNVADSETQDRISKVDDEVTLIDTVSYENVLSGKEYEVTGVLMDKETGEPLLVNGEKVTSTKKFTAPVPENGAKYVSGTVDVEFKFDGSALANHAIVVFEDVTYKGITVFTHADLTDLDQTQYFPDGHTTIVDDNTKDQITYAQGDISLTDTVHYEGLLADREYEVTGVLYSKKTGKPLMVDGKEVTATTKFTTPAVAEGEEDRVSGTVDVTFKFKGSSELEDDEWVAFETVKRNGAEVFVHEDIDDVAQTVTVPGGKTNATDSETKGHASYADKEVTIIDRVDYEGLLPEKEYTVEGKLMNQETGKPILVDGKEVTASAKFTTPKAEDGGLRVSGSVDVTFTFDGSALAGTSTVVFEDVYYNGVKVFTHADLKDEAQTVKFPSVKTTVKDAADGDKAITATGTATMVDTVTYTGLEPGKSYTLEGVIMDKATGKPLTVDGKEVTASTVFVPEKSDGTAEVTFKFDASKVKPGNYVVFETLTETETKVIVGDHKDIEDKDQTFVVNPVPSNPPVKTGDNTNVIMWAATAAGALAIGLFLAFKRKKEDDEEEAAK